MCEITYLRACLPGRPSTELGLASISILLTDKFSLSTIAAATPVKRADGRTDGRVDYRTAVVGCDRGGCRIITFFPLFILLLHLNDFCPSSSLSSSNHRRSPRPCRDADGARASSVIGQKAQVARSWVSSAPVMFPILLPPLRP